MKTYKSTWEWQVIAAEQKAKVQHLSAWLTIVAGLWLATALTLLYVVAVAL